MGTGESVNPLSVTISVDQTFGRTLFASNQMSYSPGCKSRLCVPKMVEMGNLGGYQELTTAAKVAGGPENLIDGIKAAAAYSAKREGQQQGGLAGVIGALALVGVLGAGVYLWKRSGNRKAAPLNARSEAAEVQLGALISDVEAEQLLESIEEPPESANS